MRAISQRLDLDQIRRRFSAVFVDPVTTALVAMRLRPNHITFLGLLTVIAGAILIPLLSEHLWVAGIVILVGSALDLFDGAVARRRHMVSAVGAFLDSSTDRIQEFAVTIALAYYLLYVDPDAPRSLLVLLAFTAQFGSMMGSYLRARAEAAGIRGSRGFVTRAEKVLIIVFFLLIGNIPLLVWVLASATAFGVLWRFAIFWRALRNPPPPTKPNAP